MNLADPEDLDVLTDAFMDAMDIGDYDTAERHARDVVARLVALDKGATVTDIEVQPVEAG